MEPNFLDFKRFVIAQDANKTINHNNGWYSCAVGEYLNSIDKLSLVTSGNFRAYEIFGDNFDDIDSRDDNYRENRESVGNRLNNYHFDTYGELQKFIIDID